MLRLDHLLSRDSGAITPVAPGSLMNRVIDSSEQPGRLELCRPRSRQSLLSFERPSSMGGFLLGARARSHLENSIATHNVFFSIKRTRAHGGCLGAKSR